MSNMFDPIINNLAAKAEDENPIREGDYQENGLWYCGKCHTPKQAVNLFGVVPCMCKCKNEEFERKRAEERLKNCADEAISKAFDNHAMRGWTFENDDGSTPKYTNAARNYCDNFDEFYQNGKGLLLWNTQSGSGKSYMAAMIVNELCSRGIFCRMTSTARILSDINSTYRYTESEYTDDLMKNTLLVIDDFGAERDSSYALEKVYGIIDYRITSCKPLIITTNLSIETIKNPTEERTMRIYSRILKSCHPIHVEGCDRRKVIAAKEYMDTKEILGI